MDRENQPLVIGIDPGREGALVVLQGSTMSSFLMPLLPDGKSMDVSKLYNFFVEFGPNTHIFLERFIPFKGTAYSNFSFGRGFGALEALVAVFGFPCTYIEAAKWSRAMHQGIDAKLPTKKKSDLAVRRLFPRLVKDIPANRNGKLHEGVVDALLIAEYGRRMLRQ